jgi:uncharacterized protein YxjI
MEYVMSSRWSLLEHFEITDGVGTPQFEARGHLGSRITLHDTSGREVADIRKHLMTDTHEVYVGGQRAAQVRHAGIFGDKYDIQPAFGYLNARGHFDGGDYMISRDGIPVLAIEAIHDERRQQGGAGGLGIGGMVARDIL